MTQEPGLHAKDLFIKSRLMMIYSKAHKDHNLFG